MLIAGADINMIGNCKTAQEAEALARQGQQLMAEIHALPNLIELLKKHVQYTHSETAQMILDHWEKEKGTFVKVYPRDYHRMRDLIDAYTKPGLSEEQVIEKAFDEAMK